MNDSEYAARWRILAAQLSKLEREAGIGSAPAAWREAMWSSSLRVGDAARRIPYPTRAGEIISVVVGVELHCLAIAPEVCQALHLIRLLAHLCQCGKQNRDK